MIFLTAEWRDLAMLNYAVDPALIAPLVPPGTELDFFEGKTYITLVGFRFLRTKVLGVTIPFHQNFEEINLRFYVRRTEGDTIRRGVVFIREIVPRYAIANVARLVFNENYVALPTSHDIVTADTNLRAEYRWRYQGRWNSIRVQTSGPPAHPALGSPEQFITEHYWGYCAQRDKSCMEYRVEHPPWRVWKTSVARFEGDAAGLYGPQYAPILNREPDSAFLAEGSPVIVAWGGRSGFVACHP